MRPFHVYHRGRRGTTEPCLQALRRTLAVKRPTQVTLISSFAYHTEPTSHGFVLAHCGQGGRRREYTVIVDGFASGYSGTGPRGLVSAMAAILEANISLRGVVIGSNLAEDLYMGPRARHPLDAETLWRWVLADDREQQMVVCWSHPAAPLVTVAGNGIAINPTFCGPELDTLRRLVPGWAAAAQELTPYAGDATP